MMPNPSLGLEEVRSRLELVRGIKYVGLVLACYFAMGFINKHSASLKVRFMCGVVVAIPLVALATFPDIQFSRLPTFEQVTANLGRLSYYSLSAFVGVFLGLRFNQLKNI